MTRTPLAAFTGCLLCSAAAAADPAALEPAPIERPSFWYARLSGGAIGTVVAGLGYGMGYRYSFDRIAIDISYVGLSKTTDRNHGDLKELKLELLGSLDPRSSRAPYVGGGISLGAINLDRGSSFSNGSGVQLEVSAGFDLLRGANGSRAFIQADLTLPCYGIEPYAPVVMVSLGFGIGH